MPITIGPFDNVPAPNDPIRSNWPQEISQYVVDNHVIVAPMVRANVSTTPLSIPAGPVDRSWVITWSWWMWGSTANGNLSVTLRYQGGANIGSYTIPFAASASPIPTLSGTSFFTLTKTAGGSATALEAVITGGTAGWSADGWLLSIGYP